MGASWHHFWHRFYTGGMDPGIEGFLTAWRDGGGPAPIANLVGARLVAFGPGTGTVELDASPALHNPRGTVQGGLHAVLADVAMGVAVATALPDSAVFATTNLSIQYLRAATTGRLVAHAEATYIGGSTAHVSCLISGPEGDVALVTSTCRVRR